MVRIFLVVFMFLSLSSLAQVREIPAIVKDSFAVQYPNAGEVTYEDNLLGVQVHFTTAGSNMVASYTNKGKWKETEKEWSFDLLPEEVKLGFSKSKYADWKVIDTKVVYRPGGVEQYKIKVEKSDIQKKNLYFNTSGRLVDDGITL